ncbi:MAG: LysM peptidoglycan-binding domain-containing protein [Saprospiraceae bacterium]
MKILRSLFVLLLFVTVKTAFSQNTLEPIWLLTPRDSVLLIVEDGRKVVLHTVKPKQTLFSISRFYSLGMEKLIDYNPALKENTTLQIGSTLKIPIPNKAIRRYKGKFFKSTEYTPIYYIVQSGENLFQICKRYFDMPVDTIMKRNRLKDVNIKPGQRLHIGWMGIEGIHADWRKGTTNPQDEVFHLHYTQERNGREEFDGQGVCFWQKDSKENGDLYAMHREAGIGTIISVYNPMSQRTVYAKVISRIPDGFERNTEVILSPGAARKIGAIDPKFFVKVKYIK